MPYFFKCKMYVNEDEPIFFFSLFLLFFLAFFSLFFFFFLAFFLLIEFIGNVICRVNMVLCLNMHGWKEGFLTPKRRHREEPW
jgi:hypothetical protein